MTSKIQLFPSGIPLVDLEWGGLYRGGTYFLIGPQKSGRTLLSLQYAFECALRKEICVYFTTLRPKDLLIHAASIGFDLQHYMNQNLVIVVKVSPPEQLKEVEDHDGYLAEYITDIISVIKQYNPSKLVFDELTPFIGFKSIDYLKEIFSKTIEQIEDNRITSLFILAHPANPAAQYIVDTLAGISTGIITLEKQKDRENKYFAGIMSIIANIGHTEGNFSSEYFIEPDKGVTVNYSMLKQSETIKDSITEKSEEMVDTFSDISLKYESIDYPNVYSLDDFQLFINNQIAMFQITGKVFKLAAIWLDEVAEAQKLLNIHQLQNAIRISTDKKHKICAIGNKVFILIQNPSKSTIVNLVSEIKSNLPEDDPEYLQIVSRLISIYSVDVDKNVKNAEGMIAQILKATSTSPG